MLMVGLLFRGKPVPLHSTVPPESAHPATFKAAGLTVIPAAIAAGDMRSNITSGMLFAQSWVVRPVVRKEQFGVAGVIETIDGLVMPPKEFPTS